ncbi:MAG TPA: biosynthetic peptidoglycan transglycosylase [Anaeromyxobacter sp.]|nr:biosynthetic peptidoglycan transglycosylase [Anaeromyxobacter sp.]
MSRPASPFRRFLLRVAMAATLAVLAAAGGVACLWLALPDPAPLARGIPSTTALIEQRRAEARAHHRILRPARTWVPLERVPRHVLDAVLVSEDARFFGHEGIDWEATREAVEHDLYRGQLARGGSTITQQLAKNLWLGTERTIWRKVKEAVLARKLEHRLPKRRILSLYLNVAEWGDGVFGIEAGARAHFGVDVDGLSVAQGVVLASMLPAPRRVSLAQPSTWLKRRSRRLLDRMAEAGRLSAEDHLHASSELDRILAGPQPDQDEEEPPEEATDAGGQG